MYINVHFVLIFFLAGGVNARAGVLLNVTFFHCNIRYPMHRRSDRFNWSMNLTSEVSCFLWQINDYYNFLFFAALIMLKRWKYAISTGRSFLVSLFWISRIQDVHFRNLFHSVLSHALGCFLKGCKNKLWVIQCRSLPRTLISPAMQISSYYHYSFL